VTGIPTGIAAAWTVIGQTAVRACVMDANTTRGHVRRSSHAYEQFAVELEQIIALSEPIQTLAEASAALWGPAEGPVWWQEATICCSVTFITTGA